MAYETKWLVLERILVVTLCGEVSKSDLTTLVEYIENTIKNATSPVHLILLPEQLSKYPRDIQDNYKSYRHLSRQQIGWFILISENSVLQYLTSTTSRLIGLRWRAYPTLSAAIDFLKKVDSSIDWDTAEKC